MRVDHDNGKRIVFCAGDGASCRDAPRDRPSAGRAADYSNVHIDDLVELYLLVLERAPGDTFFAKNRHNSFREIAAMISRLPELQGRTASVLVADIVGQFAESARLDVASNGYVRADNAHRRGLVAEEVIVGRVVPDGDGNGRIGMTAPVLDHITLRTHDLEGTRAFLETLLDPRLGYRPDFPCAGY